MNDNKEIYLQIKLLKRNGLEFAMLLRSMHDNIAFDRTEVTSDNILELFIARSCFELVKSALKTLYEENIVDAVWISDINYSSVFGNYRVHCVEKLF